MGRYKISIEDKKINIGVLLTNEQIEGLDELVKSAKSNGRSAYIRDLIIAEINKQKIN